MKTLNKISTLCALVMMAATPALADGEWEVWTGGLGSLDIYSQGATSITQINLFNTGSNYKMTPTLGYNLGGGLELLFSPAFMSSSSAGSTNSALSLMAGAAFNFMGNLDEAVFFKAEAGIVNTSPAAPTVGTTDFQWMAGIGKRFKIVDHVTWAPEFDFRMVHSAASQTILNFIPVQFTFMF